MTNPTAQPIATAAKYRPDTTITRALSDATRASLAAAAQAHASNELRQVELAPQSGVWRLTSARS